MSIATTYSTNYLSKTGVSGGPGAGAWTIAGWVQWTANDDQNQLLTISEGGFDELGGVEMVSGSTAFRFYVLKSSAAQDFSVSSGATSANTWYHVAVTWSPGGNVTGYLNGVSVGSAAASITTPLTLDYLEIGYADAVVSDVCYYAAALSADEIAQLYTLRRPRRRANLFARYPCFFGSRTVDYSGVGNNATEAGTLTDPGLNPPAGWGSTSPRLILPASSALVQLVGSGGIQSAGSATITATKALSGSGGVASAGAGTITATKALSGSGGVASAGSATVSAQKDLAGSGGVQSAGSATITATKALGGSGGVQSAGFATLTGGTTGPVIKPAALATRRGAVLYGSRRRIR